MKYMGSKNKLAKHLLPIILADRKPGQHYVEPFTGGANMFDKVPNPRIGGELNKYIASLLIAIRDGWLPPKSVTEAEWLHVKNNKDEYHDYFVGYCGVCLTFGSVWFCAYARGDGRNYAEEAFRNLSRQAPKLKGAELYCNSYEDLIIPEKSIVYCDPPYKGTDKYRGFEQIDHTQFWAWCRRLVGQGHKVFISEYTAPEDFMCIWEGQIKSGMAETRGIKVSTERLFVHSLWDLL